MIEKKVVSKLPTASKEQLKQFNDTCILTGKDPRMFGDKNTIDKYGKYEDKRKEK